MSGMSSMLRIHPERGELPRATRQFERGTAFRDISVPSGSSPVSFRRVASGRFPVERDPQYAVHAAHAVDPSVLDAGRAAAPLHASTRTLTIAVRPRLQFADRREVAGRRASVKIE